MRKTEVVIKEETRSRIYCDLCGEELTHKAHCVICKRDLCPNCVGYELDDGSDYSDYWCKDCWKIGAPYREKIKLLENEIEQLYCDWEKSCKSQET